ncbi:MAG: hypothetical protein LLG13_16350 [Bacteroidales bacterium]|nr:hypothetical protein [Bacteroidales bacterium]
MTSVLVAAGPFISLLPAATPRAVPSTFIFVMVFVAYALAAHAGFCFCVNGSLEVKTKPARAAPPFLYKNTRQK